jgi:hypothetical protein
MESFKTYANGKDLRGNVRSDLVYIIMLPSDSEGEQHADHLFQIFAYVGEIVQ